MRFGKEDTALNSGKEIGAADGKSNDRSVRQAGIDRCPTGAIIGGKEDTTASSGKEIGAPSGQSLPSSALSLCATTTYFESCPLTAPAGNWLL